jgi:tripeptide aminopeptidase
LIQAILNEGKMLGLTQIPRTNGGGTDANVYIGKGLQPLVLAIGMTDVHSTRESVAVKDIEALTQLLISIAYRGDSLPVAPLLRT